MTEQRLERRTAGRAFAGTPVAANDVARSDRRRVRWQRERHEPAVATMGNPAHQDRVRVEPEAQRLHNRTVARSVSSRQGLGARMELSPTSGS
jgi:hypothetical protein